MTLNASGAISYQESAKGSPTATGTLYRAGNPYAPEPEPSTAPIPPLPQNTLPIGDVTGIWEGKADVPEERRFYAERFEIKKTASGLVGREMVADGGFHAAIGLKMQIKGNTLTAWETGTLAQTFGNWCYSHAITFVRTEDGSLVGQPSDQPCRRRVTLTLNKEQTQHWSICDNNSIRNGMVRLLTEAIDDPGDSGEAERSFRKGSRTAFRDVPEHHRSIATLATRLCGKVFGFVKRNLSGAQRRKDATAGKGCGERGVGKGRQPLSPPSAGETRRSPLDTNTVGSYSTRRWPAAFSGQPWITIFRGGNARCRLTSRPIRVLPGSCNQVHSEGRSPCG